MSVELVRYQKETREIASDKLYKIVKHNKEVCKHKHR